MALKENGSQECLVRRAEWPYILVEDKFEAQAKFWAVGSNLLFDLNN